MCPNLEPTCRFRSPTIRVGVPVKEHMWKPVLRVAWSRLCLEQLLALLTVAVTSSKRVMPWHFSIAVQHGPRPSVPTHAGRAQSCMRNEGLDVTFRAQTPSGARGVSHGACSCHEHDVLTG